MTPRNVPIGGFAAEPHAPLTRREKSAELCKFLCMAGFVLIIPLFLRFAPEWAERFYPRCVWNAATGLYCPGCGTLRALRAIGGLDFWGAFRYNPFLFIIIVPLAGYMGAVYLIRGVTGRRVASPLSSYRAALPAGAAIAAVWVVRNVFNV